MVYIPGIFYVDETCFTTKLSCKISLECKPLVTYPAKKNNIPHFLNQPYINSYNKLTKFNTISDRRSNIIKERGGGGEFLGTHMFEVSEMEDILMFCAF